MIFKPNFFILGDIFKVDVIGVYSMAETSRTDPGTLDTVCVYSMYCLDIFPKPNQVVLLP